MAGCSSDVVLGCVLWLILNVSHDLCADPHRTRWEGEGESLPGGGEEAYLGS